MYKKRIWSLFFIIIAPLITNAQVDVNTYLKTALVGKKKLKDIMHIVDSFYKANPEKETEKEEGDEPFESDYLFWKRWELYNNSRLDENGELVDIGKKNFDAYFERINYDELYRTNDKNESNIGGRNTSANTSNGDWSFVGPTGFTNPWNRTIPGNGRVDRVAFHPTNPNIIYAGSAQGGLWKTVDGGTNWTSISSFANILAISSIVIDKLDPNIIYVLTGSVDDYGDSRFTGIMKSIDGGINWQKGGEISASPSLRAYKIIQNPSNTNLLYVATSQGLFKTTDGAATWVNLTTNSCDDVALGVINNNKIFIAGKGLNNFWYSLNGGVSFTQAQFSTSLNNNGFSKVLMSVCPTNPNKIYLISGPGSCTTVGGVQSNFGFQGLYASTDGGLNFSLVRNTPNILGTDNAGNDCGGDGYFVFGIAVSPINANTIIISSSTIWGSTDGGINNMTHLAYFWGGPIDVVHPDVHSVDYNPLDNKLYASTDGGLYVSNDNGIHWTPINQGLNCTQLYHFTGAYEDASHIICAMQDNGIQSRTSYTATFNHVYPGDGYSGAYDPNDKTKFGIIINEFFFNFIQNGATEISRFKTANFYPFITRHPSNSGIIYLGGNDTLYKSIDAGITFTKINSIGGNRGIVICRSNPSIIYSANNNKIWKSINSGSSWVELTNNTGFPIYPNITSIAANPTNTNQVFLTCGGYSATKKVFYSNDGGINWQNISTNLPNILINCMVINIDNSAYIGTDDGVYYKSPTATNWLPFYNGLPHVRVTDLQIFYTLYKIYASTYGRGVWFSNLKEQCDFDITLYGQIGGANFLQASNAINSTQNITGINGTRVYYRAGNNITLTPGFEAKAGNELKAYIGTCDVQGVTVFRTTNSREIPYPNFVIESNENKTSSYPYGYIEYTFEENKNKKVNIYAKQTGEYNVDVCDRLGNKIEKIFNAELKEGKNIISVNPTNIANGNYFITLSLNGRLIHFLEWEIKN